MAQQDYDRVAINLTMKSVPQVDECGMPIDRTEEALVDEYRAIADILDFIREQGYFIVTSHQTGATSRY